MESWEKVRRMPDYLGVVGPKLYTKFFALEPDAMPVLGFPKTMDPLDPKIQSSGRFQAHSKFFVQLLDRALDMLGPADDVLTDILRELGKDHRKMGVKPCFFAPLGTALIEILEEELPAADFTEATKGAWVEVYTALSSDIIQSITAAD
ncbi:MAG: hypothetical protein SGILL_009580 [Bacillariaceae sp.]